MICYDKCLVGPNVSVKEMQLPTDFTQGGDVV